MKIIEQKINRFDGGIANDIRDNDMSQYAFTRNFDALSFPHRLLPYRAYESGNDTVARKIANFLVYNNILWGLGEQTSPKRAQIFYKDTFTDGTWSTTANNVVPVTVPSVLYDTFTYYKGFIFGFSLNQSIWKYDVTGVAALSVPDGSTGVDITTTANGVVHSKDDKLYMAFNNVVVSKSGAGGAWNTAAITLPTNMVITSLCEYGNFLAIACVGTDLLGQTSKVFLWDRDSSVTTLTESIDWGYGSLNVLEELEGILVGISLIKRETSGGLIFNSVLSFKQYMGAQGAVEFARLDGTRATDTSPISYLGKQKLKRNNRLYFMAMLSTAEGTQTKDGIWSVGRSGVGRPYVISNECPARNDNTSVPNALDGFHIIGSYVFVAYSESGSLEGNISKTDDDANFTSNSKYESLIFDGGDTSLTKKLLGVTVNTRALPAAGSVVLGYRIDENIKNASNFNTIFTNTTDDSITHSAVNIESTGATLPEFKEIQFQIISTGGAEITGLSFQYELMGKRLY